MRRVILVLAILMSTALCSFAGTTLQQEYDFLAFNGGDWQNGYPYYIKPVPDPTGQVFAMMCDDWGHGGFPGQDWTTNITNLGSQNITLARFNNIPTPYALGPLTLYEEAGWILQQTPMEQTSEWKFMNYAVWHIFNSDAPLLGDASTWLADAQAQAAMHFPGDDFSDVWIVTPLNQHDPDPNGPQEFLYLGQDPPVSNGLAGQPTPEPGTWLLMGTGLLAVIGRKFWN